MARKKEGPDRLETSIKVPISVEDERDLARICEQHPEFQDITMKPATLARKYIREGIRRDLERVGKG